MRSTSIAMRRPASLGLLGLALVLALSLFVLLAAPQAQAATLRLDGMQTTLTTDPGTTGALWAAGIIPLPVAPSTVSPTSDAARYTFPITTGRVDAKTTAGFIKHSGGLLLARYEMGWQALKLTKFTINITGAPNLTAIVNDGARVEIADSRSQPSRDQDLHEEPSHLPDRQERWRHPQRDCHGRHQRHLRHLAAQLSQARHGRRAGSRRSLTSG